MENIKKCLSAIRQITDFVPQVGIVLGSGLGSLAEEIKTEAIVNYKDIEGFPVSTVQGHKGRFVFGYIKNTPVVIMQGRVHYYEGYTMEQAVMPIRIMKMLGITKLLLTNAAGGINYNFKPGDLMIITDHISSLVPSPLVGKNYEELGTRFPDMSQVYSPQLSKGVKKAAVTLGITIKEGVYIQLSGPNYETPAEVRMCRILGADAVGMSTACEAVAAKHMGLEICGISFISNLACGMTAAPLSHKEVEENGRISGELFKSLVKLTIANWEE